MRRTPGAVVLVLAGFLAFSAAVLAQAGRGAISGKVRDDKLQPLAGAMVTVTSAFLQGPRSQAPMWTGSSSFPTSPRRRLRRLRRGPGYAKVIQSKVLVTLGNTVTLDLSLARRAGPRWRSRQGRLSSISSTPSSARTSRRRSWSSCPSAGRCRTPSTWPAGGGFGAERVGGRGRRQSGRQGFHREREPLCHRRDEPHRPGGGCPRHGLQLQLRPGDFGQHLGAGCRHGCLHGGLFSILTKSGSNEFHGELFGYYTAPSFSANADSVDPSASGDQPHHSYDYGFDVGGPILKDRLWFFAGYNPSYSSRTFAGDSILTSAYVPGLTAAIPYQYDSSVRDWVGMAKFTFRVNDNHNLEATILTSPQHAWLNEGVGNFLGGAPLVPVTDPMARMTRRYQSGFAAGLTWYANWTQNFYMETKLSRVQAVGRCSPGPARAMASRRSSASTGPPT